MQLFVPDALLVGLSEPAVARVHARLAQVSAIVDRYAAARPVPQMIGPGPSDDAFENRCRTWVRELAEQIVHDLEDATWGVKASSPTNPQSKDSITNTGVDPDIPDGLVPGRLLNFDLLGGVGTGHPTLGSSVGAEDISAQHFIPVQPIDHLGTGSGGGNGGSGGGATTAFGEAAATFEQQVNDLRAVVVRLEARVAALEASGGGQPDLNGLKIALVDDSGHFVTAEQGQPDRPLLANRDALGPWETFTIRLP